MPTAVAFGIPVEVGPVRAGLAVVTSLLLWALLGWWAGRRVSERVVGGWREWVVEFGWVVLCLWAGVLTGVGVLLHLAADLRSIRPAPASQLIELRGPDASHLEQLIDRSERPVALAVGHDRLRGRRSDTRECVEIAL